MSLEQSNQSHWIPLADMMTGLMIVFMLLTAIFILNVEKAKKKTEQATLKLEQTNKILMRDSEKLKKEEEKTAIVVERYESTKNSILSELQKEFGKDLKQWNAEILSDMTIRFNDPSVLFQTGSSDLRPRFQEILDIFFPRYISLLTSDEFKNDIKEIRIEGHTSIFWNGTIDEKEAYFKNMELSQARTRTTLEYLLSSKNIKGKETWLIQHITANGLSSSRPISEDPFNAVNQRVEFRIVTNANEKMDLIAEGIFKK